MRSGPSACYGVSYRLWRSVLRAAACSAVLLATGEPVAGLHKVAELTVAMPC